jgi:hypothetical protein
MSITSGPINEGEQATEKAADHIADHTEPAIIRIIDAVFQRLWKTRIIIDITERQ